MCDAAVILLILVELLTITVYNFFLIIRQFIKHIQSYNNKQHLSNIYVPF